MPERRAEREDGVVVLFGGHAFWWLIVLVGIEDGYGGGDGELR